MKKNKMCRMASALLILVLLTTSIVGSTFAKYTTTGSVSDTARVAKWGVAVTTSGSLYSNAYAANAKTDGTADLPTAWTANPASDAITVAAVAETDDIVAPGTKSFGDGLNFGITGKPEVAVTVTTTIKTEDIYLEDGTYGVLVKATVKDLESLKKLINTHADGVYSFDGASTYTLLAADSATYDANLTYYVLTDKATVAVDYYPVKYDLAGSAAGTDMKAMGAAEKLAQVLKNDAANTITDASEQLYKASYTADHTYPALTDLAASGPKFSDEKLSWEWKFEDGADADAIEANNAADTILGNLIEAKKNNAVAYKVVSVDAAGAVTVLTVATGADDFTVSDGTNTVANLRTQFNIELTVTQVD